MPASTRWLGSGEIGSLVRAGGGGTDLADLGPVDAWPVSLQMSFGIALASSLPMLITWGPTFRLLYNDGFRPLMGKRKHPIALGGEIASAFPVFWLALGHAFERVRSGEAVGPVTWYLPLARNGDFDNRWFAVVPSAMRDELGVIGGVLAILVETTEQVDAARRLATLRDLTLMTADARSAEGACANAATILWKNPIDVPFGAIYLVDDTLDTAERCCIFGIAPDHRSSPTTMSLVVDSQDGTWPIARIVRTGKTETITEDARHIGRLPGGAYPEPAHTTVLVPLGLPGLERPLGVFVAGISPRRALDQTYLEFLALAATQLAGAIGRGRMSQVLRRQVEAIPPTEPVVDGRDGEDAIADLRDDRDRAAAKARATRHESEATQRAKDEFLALLGHELRDPLAPMDTVLRLMRRESGSEEMFPKEREILERQLSRLSELVDELRDVARLTRGGIELARRPVSLAAVLERACEMADAPLARHQHLVSVSASPVGLDIDGDETRLAQAIAGLVASAAGHAEDGSRVEVGSHREDSNVVITIRQAPRDAPRVAADLLDGDAALAREPRARRSDRGMGVGFPILRNIIVLHGGSVRPTGEDGASGFDVRLPLVRPWPEAEGDGGLAAVSADAPAPST